MSEPLIPRVDYPYPTPDKDDWQSEAACKDADTEIFYPDKGKNAREARAICIGKCAVRVQCLTYAMNTDQRHGTWGGLTAYERGQLRKSMRE